LFLDEIGDATPAVQKTLLRTLQEGMVRRIGDRTWRPVDVRIVAATNKPLDGEHLREDLRYRLAHHEIHLPPLRQRRDDILAIADEHCQATYKSPLPPLTTDGAEGLLLHQWPGNVRELTTEAERLGCRRTPGEMVTLELVRRRLRPERSNLEYEVNRISVGQSPEYTLMRPEEWQTEYDRHGGSYSAMARAIGCDRKTIRKYVQMHVVGRGPPKRER
jgi:transcriptional regulator with PAS, ATPase and Fis domain